MKKDIKTYEKPMIAFVDFSISSSIAANCKHMANSTDTHTCYGYEDGEFIVYTSKNSCDIPVDDDDVCYHVPSVDTSVFAS